MALFYTDIVVLITSYYVLEKCSFVVIAVFRLTPNIDNDRLLQSCVAYRAEVLPV